MAQQGEPQISVLVAVKDGARPLRRLLDSLARQTLSRDRFEVVVIDNGSRDATAAVAERGGARVLSEPVPNRAAARNRGIETVRSAWVAITDADCVASPRWLEALLECQERAPMIAGPVLVSTSQPPNAVERFEALWRFGQEHWVREGWAATANLCLRTDVLRAVGGFDPAYRHIGEDADLCVRARRAGFDLGWCPDAAVEHPAERRLGPMLRRVFWHGYSNSQAYYRLGMGGRAWRHPAPALRGDGALTAIGARREAFDAAEWQQMLRLARASHAARILGSLWAEVRRAR